MESKKNKNISSNVETRFVDMSTNISNELKNGQYVVLASQPDGVISIGKEGKYGFDTLKEAVDIQFDHLNIDKDVKVSVFEVQKKFGDKNGLKPTNLVQAELENLFIGEDPDYIRNGSYAVCQSITCTDGIINNTLEFFNCKQEAIEGEFRYVDTGYTNTFVAQLFRYKNDDSDTPLFKAYRLSDAEFFITD